MKPCQKVWEPMEYLPTGNVEETRISPVHAMVRIRLVEPHSHLGAPLAYTTNAARWFSVTRFDYTGA